MMGGKKDMISNKEIMNMLEEWNTVKDLVKVTQQNN